MEATAPTPPSVSPRDRYLMSVMAASGLPLFFWFFSTTTQATMAGAVGGGTLIGTLLVLRLLDAKPNETHDETVDKTLPLAMGFLILAFCAGAKRAIHLGWEPTALQSGSLPALLFGASLCATTLFFLTGRRRGPSESAAETSDVPAGDATAPANTQRVQQIPNRARKAALIALVISCFVTFLSLDPSWLGTQHAALLRHLQPTKDETLDRTPRAQIRNKALPTALTLEAQPNGTVLAHVEIAVPIPPGITAQSATPEQQTARILEGKIEWFTVHDTLTLERSWFGWRVSADTENRSPDRVVEARLRGDLQRLETRDEMVFNRLNWSLLRPGTIAVMALLLAIMALPMFVMAKRWEELFFAFTMCLLAPMFTLVLPFTAFG